MDVLANILYAHPALMRKFFALQSCLLANRFLLSTFKTKRAREMTRCATLSSWMNLPVPTEQKKVDRKGSLDQLNKRSSSVGGTPKNPKLKAARATLGDRCKGEEVLGQYQVDVARKGKKHKKMTLFLFETEVVFYSKTLYSGSVKCTGYHEVMTSDHVMAEAKVTLVKAAESVVLVFASQEEATGAHAILLEKVSRPGSPAVERRPSGPEIPSDTMTGADDVFAFTGDELSDLFELGEYQRLEHGKVLLRRGEHSTKLYQVIQGKCRVFLADYEEGDAPCASELAQKSLVIAEDGVIGELSFIQKGAASATVVAWSTLHSVIVMAWDKHVLEDYFATHERFAGKFYRLLALNITDRLLLRQREDELGRLRNSIADTVGG